MKSSIMKSWPNSVHSWSWSPCWSGYQDLCTCGSQYDHYTMGAKIVTVLEPWTCSLGCLRVKVHQKQYSQMLQFMLLSSEVLSQTHAFFAKEFSQLFDSIHGNTGTDKGESSISFNQKTHKFAFSFWSGSSLLLLSLLYGKKPQFLLF